MTGIAELDLFAKVVLAGLLGFLVGLEREWMGSPGGDRTSAWWRSAPRW